MEVIITNNVDTSKLGKYIIQYDSLDKAGNYSEKKLREVMVVDRVPLFYVDPIVQIKGNDVLINVKPSNIKLDIYNSYKAENEPNEFSPYINNGDNGIFKWDTTNANIGAYHINIIATNRSGISINKVLKIKIIDKIEPIKMVISKKPFKIEFNSNKNQNYIVETSNDLKNWKLLRALIGSGGVLSIGKVEMNEFNNYYRIKVLAP